MAVEVAAEVRPVPASPDHNQRSVRLSDDEIELLADAVQHLKFPHQQGGRPVHGALRAARGTAPEAARQPLTPGGRGGRRDTPGRVVGRVARWLAAHHADRREIWLINDRKGPQRRTPDYEELLDEAVCYGWVDVLVRASTRRRYLMRWMPRRPRRQLDARPTATARGGWPQRGG